MDNFRSIARVCVLTSLLCSAACTGSLPRDAYAPKPTRPEPTAAEKRAAAVELFRLGKEQMRSGDSLRAQEYFATAIDSGGDSDVILPELMRAAISGMRYQAAIRYFEDFSALMSKAHRAELGVVVGVLYLGLEQPERARAALEASLKLAPKNARAHFLLGQILRDEFADYAAADAQYRAYLAIEPAGGNASAARAGLLKSADAGLASAPTIGMQGQSDAGPQRIER